MQKFIQALIIAMLALCLGNPVIADGSILYPGVPQAQIYSARIAVPATSTVITLTAPCSTISIFDETGASDLHVNWTGGTASATNQKIPAGGPGYTYQGAKIISFTVYGDGSTGYFDVGAN